MDLAWYLSMLGRPQFLTAHTPNRPERPEQSWLLTTAISALRDLRTEFGKGRDPRALGFHGGYCSEPSFPPGKLS